MRRESILAEYLVETQLLLKEEENALGRRRGFS